MALDAIAFLMAAAGLGNGGGADISAIVPEYNPAETYSKDTLISHEGKIYVALEDNITGAWDETKWQETNLAEAIEFLAQRISEVGNIGRYLAVWDCTTGLPTTPPPQGTPYSYTTGDYYIIGKVGTTNYMPDGTTYTGEASTTPDTGDPQVLDMYRFDGATWTWLDFGQQFRQILTNYYTKSESDSRYALLTALNNYYTKTQADAAFYGRSAIDTMLAPKLETKVYNVSTSSYHGYTIPFLSGSTVTNILADLATGKYNVEIHPTTSGLTSNIGTIVASTSTTIYVEYDGLVITANKTQGYLKVYPIAVERKQPTDTTTIDGVTVPAISSAVKTELENAFNDDRSVRVYANLGSNTRIAGLYLGTNREFVQGTGWIIRHVIDYGDMIVYYSTNETALPSKVVRTLPTEQVVCYDQNGVAHTYSINMQEVNV